MEKLVREGTPGEYFRELVEKALANQRVVASSPLSFYLVHLLDSFVRRDRVGTETGVGEDPRLAELLCHALSANGRRQQALFKTTGDLSLFVSGFFPDRLSRMSVDAGYYVQMGVYAYGRLAALSPRETVAEVFTELSRNFVQFVDVLNEVGEASRLSDNRGLLRLYERWLRTGSRRSGDLLRQAGVLLAPGSDRVH